MDRIMTPSERRKRTYDESVSGGTTHSSFSSASATTRRRKNLRRMRSNANAHETETTLRERLHHIRVLDRTNAYSKLNSELVVAPPDPVIVDYSRRHPPPIEDFNNDDWTFVKACTPVEMAHLMHFDREEHIPDEKYLESITRAVSLVSAQLSLEDYLFFPEKSDIANVRYYPGKFAGIEYATMGLKTRAEANSLAQHDAEQAWDQLMRGEHVKPHNVRLGGRGKVARMVKEEAEARVPAVGRLILMLSHRDLKLCGVTENLLTKAWSSDKFPIAVGLSWYHGGTAKFIQELLPHKKFFCFDAKKFDSSIDPWMVRIAINIMRDQFYEGMSPKYDAYWEFVFQSLVRAPIYRDDGLRLQKEVGTTSGHSHNTIAQSIITLIIAYAAFIELNPTLSDDEIERLISAHSLGDDNLAGVSGVLQRHEVEEVALLVRDMFRVDWMGKKSFATTRLLDAVEGQFEGIQFLGKYFRLGEYPLGNKVAEVPLPYRPAQETYLRLLYPEYGALTPFDTYLRVLGNYIDAAGNTAMESWLDGLLDHIQPTVGDIPTEWPPNFKRMVSRDYSNVGLEIPEPVRIDYEQWRDLVVLSRADYVARWRAPSKY